MRLKVKQLKGGREAEIEVKDDSMSVMEVKQILAEVFDIPAREQSIVFNGKALLDPQSLRSYGITEGSRLYLTHRPSRAPVTTSLAGGDCHQSLSAGTGQAPCELPVAMEVEEEEERLVLSVKVIKGGKEEIVEVESDKVTVLEVKKVLERRCDIPTYQQSLIMAGKALADSQRLCDCNIKSGAKLFLAQKSSHATPPPPPVPVPHQSSTWRHKTQFWDQLLSHLLRHFSKTDADNIIHKMEEELRHCVYDINLDTIEAMAIRTQQQQTHPPPHPPPL